MSDYPIIKRVRYNKNGLSELNQELINDPDAYRVIFRFPTVYIIIDKVNSGYHAYVGETNDIDRRTNQHLVEQRDDFIELNQDNTNLLVIGHNHFNKSLTLDIENRMMMYLLSSNQIKRLNNRRTNDQDEYYTSNELNPIFSKIWRQLHRMDGDIFPAEETIKLSALFKSSPFHKLKPGQYLAATRIEKQINDRLTQFNDKQDSGTLILVEGAAGTGKTVLLSQIFNNLNKTQQESNHDHPKAYLLVNHKEQQHVYRRIAEKLGLNKLDPDIANNPSNFINKHPLGSPKVDVVLVDEAHLLWTQSIQAYRGNNQLNELLQRAKVVVAVFDPHQILTTTGYVSNETIQKIETKALANNNLIKLSSQIRMQASNDTIKWIDDLIFNREVNPIPEDSSYDLEIAADAKSVYRAIKSHNSKDENENNGLSRMIATFDWDYKQKKKPDGSNWLVRAGNLSLPWNLQLSKKRRVSKLPWVEQPQTIDEIGSTFTIQGFDLNYAGLIIGPSVKYRNGKIIFDSKSSKNSKATNRRSINGKKVDVSEELLQNELNVLMKRGVHGLYIYAVDEELRAALLRASAGKHILK
ncbi:DUF2075 domain-containing protein [Lactobacillus sp. Sy-1]|uniref:DUF2075 domain-containing protein n=1 Tax=Lactobacillus sp. Sy-1 TaxID=2109645 RepID=UPI001C5ADEB6|nr:DUF2075 domain-containing protein [Lactobacillus sp. Sy-1]MBW1605890.1 DUF2075 domain-containing protein [Lactobacillus sp. Sy-1]